MRQQPDLPADHIEELKRQRPVYTQVQVEPLWTVAELSANLKVARSTIYDWVHEGFIPHVKVSGCVRFRPSEVKAWLDQHAQPGRTQRVPAIEA